jgi:ABC-type bacteriocin/lantibiotic exporter with double-glycine peptidase domain
VLNIIAGIIPMLMMVGFVAILNFYAKSLMLVLIGLGVVAMMVYDFVQEIREERGNKSGG